MPQRLTWLCPDDRGGGVVSVAEGCCKEAARAGHHATLLLALNPTGHATNHGDAALKSLRAEPPFTDIPARLVAWLEENPQDIVVLNGCEQADVAIPYLPAATRVVYGVHDTAERYYQAALRFESELDGIIAVSETVAERFRAHMKNPSKLHVVHNGTGFPSELVETLASPRTDDLLFLGGDNAAKGAHDVLALWPVLLEVGFSGRLHWFGASGDALRKRIKALPASARILVHGRQPRHKIFEAAGRCKVVLMLSRAESFGMVTVECMGMGCLPAAWDIQTGTREVVGALDNVFAPLGDYYALAQTVHRALEVHDSLFTASTEQIRRKFNEGAMWQRYASVFDAMMKTPPAIRPKASQTPDPYRAPVRLFQLLPPQLRTFIRAAIGKSPRLGYALRHFRGK